MPLAFNGEFIEQLTRISKSYLVTEAGSWKATSVEQQHLYLEMCQMDLKQAILKRREQRELDDFKVIRLLQSEYPLGRHLIITTNINKNVILLTLVTVKQKKTTMTSKSKYQISLW